MWIGDRQISHKQTSDKLTNAFVGADLLSCKRQAVILFQVRDLLSDSRIAPGRS
jgi:hypothetical protein